MKKDDRRKLFWVLYGVLGVPSIAVLIALVTYELTGRWLFGGSLLYALPNIGLAIWAYRRKDEPQDW